MSFSVLKKRGKQVQKLKKKPKNNEKNLSNCKKFDKIALATANWTMGDISLMIGAPLISATYTRAYVLAFDVDTVHLLHPEHFAEK